MTLGLNGNTEWKTGYREGFADGYAQAKKEGFNLSPYGAGTVTGAPPVTYSVNPVASVRGTPTGLGIPPTGPFVATSMMLSNDC